MTVQVPAPFFKETRASGKFARAYQATLTPDASGKFLIRLSGSDRASHDIRAKYCTIDNTGNSAQVMWVNGILSGSVAGYNRVSFPLDLLNDYLQLSGVSGNIGITLSDQDLGIPNQDNSYLNNLAANKPIAWTPSTVTPAILDTQTVNVGTSGFFNVVYGYRALILGGLIGTINDGTANVYSGDIIDSIMYDQAKASIIFALQNNVIPVINNNWNILTINGTAFNRLDATFTTPDFNYSGDATFIWSGITTNPFPAVGNNASCVFT